MMTFETYVFLFCGAAAGGFINGLAGFGTALFALGFWLQILPPAQAVAMGVVMSVASGLQGVWVVRKTVFEHRARMLVFLLPALIGIPVGLTLLKLIPVDVLKFVIAAFMLLYGGFFAFRSNLPKLRKSYPIVDGIVGFLGGVLGAAAGLSGALPTMWCAMYPWSKSETRAILQPFNVLVLGLAMLAFAINGAYTWELSKIILIALPVTLMAAQIGITIFKHLNDNQFRRLIIGLLLMSGIVLMARQLLG
jgi:uncharacterized membrane protein YfcA